MLELFNNFFEKYVKYQPRFVEEFEIDKLDVDDKRLLNTAVEPIFDPNYGFEKGRKIRKSLATPEEVFSAQLPNRTRDYCAHHFIRLKACARDNMLTFYGCMHYKEEHGHCLVEDNVMAQKEYERENRLLQRNRRIKRMERGLEAS